MPTRPTRRRNFALAACLAGAAAAGCATNSGGGLKPEIASVPPPKAVDLYVQGYIQFQQGNDRQAEKSLLAAVDQNPDLRMARATLGDIYRRRGEWSNAADQYEAAVRLDPYTLSNHYYLGLSYQYLRRLREAAKAYSDALRIDANDLNSNMNLGLVYLALNELDNAVFFLERATRIDPNNALAWSNLGVAYDSRGSFPQAEASYRRAVELDPAAYVAMQNLGANLISQGKADPAQQVMKDVLAKSDSALSHRLYGDALLLGKDYSAATVQYDAALTRDPSDTAALNGKGEVFIRQYQEGLNLDDSFRTRALEQWKKSLSINAKQERVADLVNKWESGPLG